MHEQIKNLTRILKTRNITSIIMAFADSNICIL